MKVFADTHCHTASSTHAYSSLKEMADMAAAKGMLAMAITDHGIDMPDSPHMWHFYSMQSWPREISGVKIIRGCEVNILGVDGSLDMPMRMVKHFQWNVASLHVETFLPSTVDIHTQTLLNVIENNYIDVLGHLGHPSFKFDYEKVISKCGEKKKLIEINGNSYKVRPGSHENCIEIATICKKYNTPIIINSDAHIAENIAEVQGPIQMLKDIDFPEELVINADKKRFFDYFNMRQKDKNLI